MTENSRIDDTQPRILRTFTTLHQIRPDWGGSLILSLGLEPKGAALAIAANIAGAVTLAIDSDPSHLREVVRAGAVDFVVNTLDEAIRAMKNEVRKHAPLSVALNADAFAVLAEIQERGLAPQLFANFLQEDPRISEASTKLAALGATLIDFNERQSAPSGFQSANSFLEAFITKNAWSLHTFTFDSMASLRDFDHRALSLLSPEDSHRRRWLEAAPRILRRQRPPQRSTWLSDKESSALQRT